MTGQRQHACNLRHRGVQCGTPDGSLSPVQLGEPDHKRDLGRYCAAALERL